MPLSIQLKMIMGVVFIIGLNFLLMQCFSNELFALSNVVNGIVTLYVNQEKEACKVYSIVIRANSLDLLSQVAIV